MQKFLQKVLLCLVLAAKHAAGSCPGAALAPLPYVLEHAVWRGWSSALIYAPNFETGCGWSILRLAKCLSVNGVGVAVAVDAAGKPRLRDKIGIVVFSPRLRQNATEPIRKLVKQMIFCVKLPTLSCGGEVRKFYNGAGSRVSVLLKVSNLVFILWFYTCLSLWKLEELEMNTASYDWLITTRSNQDFKHINAILNVTSVRFDQTIVVAYPTKYRPNGHPTGICANNFNYKPNKMGNADSRRRNMHESPSYKNTTCRYKRDPNCPKTQYEKNYYRATDRFKNLVKNSVFKRSGSVLPLYQAGLIYYNYSGIFEMTNISHFTLREELSVWSRQNNFYRTSEAYHIVQYFKVHFNSTLYAHYLGSWNQELSMSHVEHPYPVEARNFLGEELLVGRCNSTGADGALTLDDDGPSAPSSLDDVLQFLTVTLNTTSVSRYYTTLGYRTYEGVWTGLLGALMERSVDLALEPVTAHPPRHQDMDFIFPIAETMCNIYIRHQETSTVRDIFLAPFSARLVVCVVAVAVVAALAIVTISRLTASVRADTRPMGYMEALIWSTGILCQQGGTWTPPNPAASVLLIVVLLFAVVTYNAYAAFITSVLSVRVASVDTVAAVLHSPNFKIGYIRNGADQMYLMSTKDAQLNAFYIRGYSDAENLVSSAEEGLARAARQDYAFFSGQRAARSTLRSLSQARGRCAVRELPVQSTRAHLAFPLPRRSPYARPMLVSLLQMRSGGSLARLEAALVPAMPHCAPPGGFASARAADVRSALILLVMGLIAAFILGVGEYCWKNRKEILIFMVNTYRRFVDLVSSLI